MSAQSSLLLIGVGGAGASIARGVDRAFGGGIRLLLIDTDARTGDGPGEFALIGADRLSGRGAGGDVVVARLAAEESIDTLDRHIEGVRLAVVVTALGGGTGGGATLEIVRHLKDLGIPSIVFATTPFGFEGPDRQRIARGVQKLIEDNAGSTFFLPLDRLIEDQDDMNAALSRAIDTLAGGVTLFWRLVEKPGYIAMDVERIRRLVGQGGRGRLGVAFAQGNDRANKAVDALVRSPLLATGVSPVRATLCGVLAGEDLRLSELKTISDGLQNVFGGAGRAFDLATVNDEQTFTGRLAVVTLLFEQGEDDAQTKTETGKPRKRAKTSPLTSGATGKGRFANAEPTIWNGENIDAPTFMRKGLNLEF